MQPDPVLTVLVPAAAVAPAGPYDLTTLAALKPRLGIGTSDTSNDPMLSSMITEISIDLAHECHRVFAVETVREVFYFDQDPYPWQVPGGVAKIQLTRWPLVGSGLPSASPLIYVQPFGGLTVVQELASNAAGPPQTQTLIPGEDFTVDARRGWLVRLNPFTGVPTNWETFPTTVTYQAGFPTIPADLARACIRAVTADFQAAQRDPMLRAREAPGLGRMEYWIGSPPGVRGAWPEEILTVLDRYRVPVVA